MRFIDVLLYAFLIFFVLYISRLNNLWGTNRGVKKAKEDVRKEKGIQRKRARTIKLMRWFEWFALNFGFAPSKYKIQAVSYRIERLGLKIKVMNRNYKALEFIGLLKVVSLTGLFLMVAILVVTGSPFAFVFAIMFLGDMVFTAVSSAVISDNDEQLEKEFPDLFMVLYNRLIQGTKVRLSPTLRDYMTSIDAMADSKSKRVIRTFVSDLQNNIEIYGDDSLAIRKLRDKYTSVMIINFTNLVVQALNGVDNKDKLLAFKMELNAKKAEEMSIRADKLVVRGNRSVWILWVILFQFIAISWWAKLGGAGGLGGLLG